MRKATFLLALIGSVITPLNPVSAATAPTSFQAEVWVDNWFALYINGKKVGEDGVAYNTERSFNSSLIKFSATYPFEVGVIARDFMENESGLEYIGKSNQQIGDAGFLMQIREVKSGKIVSVTSSKWKSLVIQKAPTNPDCATSLQPLVDCKRSTISPPNGWSLKSFKDSAWKTSTEFTEQAVGVKDGYFDYKWNSATKIIWSSDLRLDNTVLFRNLITGSTSSSSRVTTSSFTLSMPEIEANSRLPKAYTCDGTSTPPTLTWSGVPTGSKSLVLIMNTIPGPPRPGEIENPNHAYLILYDIPVESSKTSSVNFPGTVGMNFKDKAPGYTPPCSQGPGDKTYTFTLYALSSRISLTGSEATEVNVMKAMTDHLIAKTELTTYYAKA